MIDFFVAIFVLGFLILLGEVILIVVCWRRGTKYRLMQLAYSEMARELRKLDDRLRDSLTMWGVEEELDAASSTADKTMSKLPDSPDPTQR